MSWAGSALYHERRRANIVGDAAVVALAELSVREVTLVDGPSLGDRARLDGRSDDRADGSAEESEAGEAHGVLRKM